MSSSVIISFLILLLLLVSLPFCFSSFKNPRRIFLISYFINIILFFVVMAALVFDNIKNHYERENISMIVNKIISLIEEKKYDYLLNSLKESQGDIDKDSATQLRKIRSTLK